MKETYTHDGITVKAVIDADITCTGCYFNVEITKENGYIPCNLQLVESFKAKDCVRDRDIDKSVIFKRVE